MRATLQAKSGPAFMRAEDFLDDDGFGTGPIPIGSRSGLAAARAIVDFTGSAPQVRGSVNANYAITLSATFYVMKCLGGGGGAGQRRADAADQADRAARDDRKCAAARGGGGRQCRDFAADRRRAVPRAGAGRARSIAGREFRIDVESDDRRLRYVPRAPFFLLRNDRGRRRRRAAGIRELRASIRI